MQRSWTNAWNPPVKRGEMSSSGGNGYFSLDSVVESSDFFGRGKVPYRVLRHWVHPASHIYKVRISHPAPDIVYLKLLSGNREEIEKHGKLIAHEYQVLKWMRDESKSKEYGVIQPLECIPSKLALITKGEEAERLDRILLRVRPFGSIAGPPILRGISAAGGWLRNLYERTKDPEKSYDIQKGVFREILHGLEKIQKYQQGREWEAWGKALVGHVRQLANSLEGTALADSLCHGDFIPGNLLLGKGGKIVVLDLTDSRRGLIYEDLATFWQWLDDLAIRRPWVQEQDLEKMKMHFLQGFFSGEVPWALVGLFCIRSAVGKICRTMQKGSGLSWGALWRARRVVHWRRRLARAAGNWEKAGKTG